jgi:NitT/TauT family transport system permease protein
MVAAATHRVTPARPRTWPLGRLGGTRATRLVALVAAVAVWEVFGRQINPVFMSYPSAIGAAFVELLLNGKLPQALVSSLQSFALGYLLSIAIGIPIGLLMGRYRSVEAGLDLFVNALYATPLVALIPLFVLWFGLGFSVKVAIVVAMALFPILINAWTGARNASKQLVELGRAFCADEWLIMTQIIVPGTIPYIMTGLRLGVGRAIIGMVMAEFFTSIGGLGGIIINAGNNFDTAHMFVPIIVLMVMGVGLTSLIGALERRFAPWLELMR